MRNLGVGAILRANPQYELVGLDRFVATESYMSDEAHDAYGALVPRPGSGLETRLVTPDTALLFLTLAAPGPLPRYVSAQLGNGVDDVILRLVADSVIEVLDGGQFVSGPSAGGLLSRVRRPTEGNVISQLSIAAVQYGQALAGLPEPELAMRLYAYGRVPITPGLRHRLRDASAVAAHLGVEVGGRLWSRLGKEWVPLPGSTGARQYWWQWAARSSRPGRSVAEKRGYKLYVSPIVEEVSHVLGELIGTLATDRGATGFKVGCDVSGLCRPDKVVVYFEHLEALHELAEVLRASLVGVGAHGVPFTASVTEDGLLSWAVDPPRLGSRAADATSWRMWVSRRLAGHLATAMAAEVPGRSAWEFALDRLQLGGVDTVNWIPAAGVGLGREQLDFG